MERIGVRELRQNASRYLSLVKAGQTVELTERGELIALLVPPGPGRSARERLLADGRLVPAESATGRARSPRPVPVGQEEPSNAELLNAERADRL